MPQFNSGSTHSATVPMTNEAAAALDYEVVLYLGTNKVQFAQQTKSIPAGGTEDFTLEVTMPSAAGDYPVYLDVFSGGNLIGSYKATQDITVVLYQPVKITSVGVGNFSYTADYLPAWGITTYSAVVWGSIGWDTPEEVKDVSIAATLTLQKSGTTVFSVGFTGSAGGLPTDPTTTQPYMPVGSGSAGQPYIGWSLSGDNLPASVGELTWQVTVTVSGIINGNSQVVGTGTFAGTCSNNGAS